MYPMRRFNWVSHTWTHQNLDWLSPEDCHGIKDSCRPTYERVYAELEYNKKLAEGVAIGRNEYIPELKYGEHSRAE